MISRFEIWLAEVSFSEIEGYKDRPILILNHIKKEVLCLRMTSKAPQTTGDFEVTKWKEAGLQKPTVVNTTIRLKLNEDKLIKRIGVLHNDDVLLLKIRHHII